MWKAPKSQEDADESAMGQAARRVSIIEGSADQPGGSDHPGTPRSLVVTEWAEGC